MIRAIPFPRLDALVRDGTAGSIFMLPSQTGDVVTLHFLCPCGCGDLDRISIGHRFKPVSAPSWHWNGSESAASLTPSVKRPCGWHGWLRGGYWESS